MKKSINFILFSLLALLVLAAGRLTADQKFIAEFFTPESVKNFARELVHYKGRNNDPSPSALSYHLRRAVLAARFPDYDSVDVYEDSESKGLSDLRRRYKREVKAFVINHRSLLKPTYSALANLVITEMVAYAQSEKLEPVKIAEVFESLAAATEKGLPFLRLALQPVSKEVTAKLAFIDSKPPKTDSKALEDHENKTNEAKRNLIIYLRETSGLSTDWDDYDTWKFGLRRAKDKSLPVVIELAEDAVQRARAKAAELRSAK